MAFNNGSPESPFSWINQGYDITPCKDKRPIVSNWQNKTIKFNQWEDNYMTFQIGLKLNELVDFDIDNHFIKRFVEKYLKSSGAIYGRQGNPLSHYLFLGEIKPKKFVMPNEFESYYKKFPHGACLCEIRSGHNHQSIVPGSKINNEQVEWNNFSGIKEYPGDLQLDISKIALSCALTILYPSKGARDDYCTAIAGVLSKHTEWSKSEIDEFVYFISVASGDDESGKRMSKGSTAKEKTYGMPKLAEIVGCNVKSISELFSWIGIADSGSCFTGLKCYTTEPKYWQIEYKGRWITVMDSGILLSYTKMSILILENCYEIAPVIPPKDWKAIVAGLLQNVQKIDAPIESSYMGVVGGVFINWLQTHSKSSKEDFRFNLGAYDTCARYEGYYWFKLEGITSQLKRKSMSFEMRKLTHFLREEFGAEPTKITIDKKELRVWKIPVANVEGHLRNNKDVTGQMKKAVERLDKREEETGHRYGEEIPY